MAGWVKSIRAGGHIDFDTGIETTAHALEVLIESEKLSVLLRCVMSWSRRVGADEVCF